MINNLFQDDKPTKVQLTTHVSPQALLEITHKLYISIQSDRSTNAMQTNHLIEVKFGLPRMHPWSFYGHFQELVNDNKNRVHGSLGMG